MAAGEHEHICFLFVIVAGRLLSFLIDQFDLNLDCFIQEIKRSIKHTFLQIDTAQVIHTTAEFLPVLELVKDLGDLMVGQESLVVVTHVHRVPRNLNGLGQIAKCQVEHVDLIVPWLVVQHEIEFFAGIRLNL